MKTWEGVERREARLNLTSRTVTLSMLCAWAEKVAREFGDDAAEVLVRRSADGEIALVVTVTTTVDP